MHNFPKLHNAMWPGLVGKGPDSEPPIGLESMLSMTAAARVDEQRFDGVDLFLAEPHTPIDADDAELDRLAEQVRDHGLSIGSCVAPVWPDTGGGSAFGDAGERTRYLEQVDSACRIAAGLRARGVRPHGVVRIDSAGSTADWFDKPDDSQAALVDTLKQAADIAERHDEQLAAEGEVCWGGMHGWQSMLDTLAAVGRPDWLGFQADMAHTLLYCIGVNTDQAPLIEREALSDRLAFDEAWKTMVRALRPWTIDFHVAQNDATVMGLGQHDRTGKHCLPDDPDGLLDIAHHAGYWLRDGEGKPTRRCRHICWDGCMFSNDTLNDQATWNSILRHMVQVREQHGWNETA